MINRTFIYRLLPLVAFISLVLIFFRGLFLEPQTIPSVKINQTVPRFHLPNLINGELIDQSIFNGKWTVLNVWASWCEACSLEHPFLIELGNQGVNLVGINYKDDEESAKAWLNSYGNPYQAVLFDKRGHVAIDFGVYGSPETFLIDKRGIIRYRHVGILTTDIWQHAFLPIIKGQST
ncbi:DsbE family thiol:disulfide interchange protein [Legionella sp. W05-934-2]|jgi:cytochrome c biogenesis protein CcmG/thiol:disulfide interchange protein DsbE|uniref:DsbE family thiol:disulfide interchange protein n=1 Tax=Legionella sp. W05-934-2 TaxID=1198649 RepID=UPI003462EB7E